MVNSKYLHLRADKICWLLYQALSKQFSVQEDVRSWLSCPLTLLEVRFFALAKVFLLLRRIFKCHLFRLKILFVYRRNRVVRVALCFEQRTLIARKCSSVLQVDDSDRT